VVLLNVIFVEKKILTMNISASKTCAFFTALQFLFFRCPGLFSECECTKKCRQFADANHIDAHRIEMLKDQIKNKAVNSKEIMQSMPKEQVVNLEESDSDDDDDFDEDDDEVENVQPLANIINPLRVHLGRIFTSSSDEEDEDYVPRHVAPHLPIDLELLDSSEDEINPMQEPGPPVQLSENSSDSDVPPPR
jgi:arsenate reductase-like glutaredoxin family protein